MADLGLSAAFFFSKKILLQGLFYAVTAFLPSSSSLVVMLALLSLLPPCHRDLTLDEITFIYPFGV